MIREDFIMDEDGDFPLEDVYLAGVLQQDAFHGFSDYQHTGDIIVAHKGWYKQSPTLGFGILRFYASEVSLNTVTRDLTLEMRKDGYRPIVGAVSPTEDGSFLIDNRYILPK